MTEHRAKREKRKRTLNIKMEKRIIIYLLFVLSGCGILFAFVDLLVPAQVRHNGEVPTTAFHVTRES